MSLGTAGVKGPDDVVIVWYIDGMLFNVIY